MNRHLRFLKNTLDALPDEVVIIADNGNIEYANKAWRDFGERNDCSVEQWEGLNYIGVCERAEADGDDSAGKARDAINAVLRDEQGAALLDYPCYVVSQLHWYRMVVTSFGSADDRYCIILHRDMTDEDEPALDWLPYDHGAADQAMGAGSSGSRRLGW